MHASKAMVQCVLFVERKLNQSLYFISAASGELSNPGFPAEHRKSPQAKTKSHQIDSLPLGQVGISCGTLPRMPGFKCNETKLQVDLEGRL